MENNNTSSKKKSFLAVWDNVELVDFVSKINFNALMKIEEELTILIEYLKMGMGVKNPTNLNEFFLHFTKANFTLSDIIKKKKSLLYTIIQPSLNIEIISLISFFIVNDSNSNIKNSLISIVSKTHESFLALVQVIINICQQNNLTNYSFNQFQRVIISNLKYPKDPQKALYSSINTINELIYNELHQLSSKRKNLLPKDILFYLSKYKTEKLPKFLNQMAKHLSPMDSNINTSLIEDENCIHCIPIPFLPPLQSRDTKLTVVLDLDETLISFKMGPSCDKGMLRMRPNVVEFLEKLKQLKCEVILFTAGTQDVSIYTYNIYK